MCNRGRVCLGTNFRLRSEEHTSELQSRLHLVCRLLLEKKKQRPTSTRIAPLSLVKPPRPLVLLPEIIAPSRKFICIAALLSEVSWNSGVVRAAEASVP